MVFRNQRLDRGQFDYLMAQRLLVGTGEGLPAAATGAGFARDFFIGRQQRAVVVFVSRLGAPAATGGLPWRRTLDGRPIAGRGPGRILRVLAEAGGEIGNLLTQGGDLALEVTKEGKESGLGGDGDLIPKLLGNGRLLRHGLVVGSD